MNCNNFALDFIYNEFSCKKKKIKSKIANFNSVTLIRIRSSLHFFSSFKGPSINSIRLVMFFRDTSFFVPGTGTVTIQFNKQKIAQFA